ncbi:MAG: hypothetical protein OXI70_12250 [Chloroflexota bacterium]|nr:hypothetical protein [Chloroflexota bacterium]
MTLLLLVLAGCDVMPSAPSTPGETDTPGNGASGFCGSVRAAQYSEVGFLGYKLNEVEAVGGDTWNVAVHGGNIYIENPAGCTANYIIDDFVIRSSKRGNTEIKLTGDGDGFLHVNIAAGTYNKLTIVRTGDGAGDALVSTLAGVKAGQINVSRLDNGDGDAQFTAVSDINPGDLNVGYGFVFVMRFGQGDGDAVCGNAAMLWCAVTRKDHGAGDASVQGASDGVSTRNFIDGLRNVGTGTAWCATSGHCHAYEERVSDGRLVRTTVGCTGRYLQDPAVDCPDENPQLRYPFDQGDRVDRASTAPPGYWLAP